eukprot:365813-Chlamydomonas_euryale.AAC.12
MQGRASRPVAWPCRRASPSRRTWCGSRQGGGGAGPEARYDVRCCLVARVRAWTCEVSHRSFLAVDSAAELSNRLYVCRPCRGHWSAGQPSRAPGGPAA